MKRTVNANEKLDVLYYFTIFVKLYIFSFSDNKSLYRIGKALIRWKISSCLVVLFLAGLLRVSKVNINNIVAFIVELTFYCVEIPAFSSLRFIILQ